MEDNTEKHKLKEENMTNKQSRNVKNLVSNATEDKSLDCCRNETKKNASNVESSRSNETEFKKSNEEKNISELEEAIENVKISEEHEVANCTDKNTAQPVILIVVGMAGSGKTTFCQRLYSWISSDKCKIDAMTGLNSHVYSVNLDPAVVNTKMPINLDIRDHIDYYDVMEKYNLGPNGAITTSLNLFLLNIEQHFELCGDFVIIDTPGQIESFTWSSPGHVLIDHLSKKGKVIMLYIVDSVVSQDPSVFMSNMIYNISLMCRYKVPVLCTFNKSDVVDSSVIEKWIRDYEVFRNALNENRNNTWLLHSLALHFEEFYNEIMTVSVSSKTGAGKNDFFEKINILLKD